MSYIDTQGIADDLGLPRRYVTRMLVKRPDFPQPAMRLSQKVVRWRVEDYRKWKQQQQEQTT